MKLFNKISSNIAGLVYTGVYTDFSVPADTTITSITGGMNVTTSTGAGRTTECNGYGDSLLSDLRITWSMKFNSGTPLNYFFGINAPRILSISPDSIQSQDATNNTPTGSVTSSNAITYAVEVLIKNNVITHTVNDGTTSKVITLTIPMATNEHNVGKFFFTFVLADCDITNFRIENTAYTGGHVLLGDSVAWGRSADNFSTTWWSQMMAGRKSAIMAHGNAGFDMWTAALHELDALKPSTVWLMGSYVDTPSGLTIFQNKYIDIVDYIKGLGCVGQINHLASFPSNGLDNILTFNAWKASTYNTGVDRYIDDYYGDLEEGGGTGSNLIDAYDAGGSHLTQAAQDIVADILINYV